MDYIIDESRPSASEMMALRGSVGFSVYDEEIARSGLAGSLYCVCARDESGMLIGMARVVGDGVTCFYIQDVIVSPKMQGNGIGRALMEHVLGYIASHKAPHAVVGLMSAKGKEGFYEKLGFVRRPNGAMGCGMVRP